MSWFMSDVLALGLDSGTSFTWVNGYIALYFILTGKTKQNMMVESNIILQLLRDTIDIF